MTDLDIAYVPIDDVALHPENPRIGNVELIARSIVEHGLYTPLVAQRSTGYVLVGNHRYKAARLLEWDSVPVIYRDVDDDQARRIMLIDNRASDLGINDESQLLSLLDAMARGAHGLLGTGYETSDLVDLVNRLTPQSLDDLAAELGEPVDSAIWPLVRIRLPPEQYTRFRTVLEHQPGETDTDRLVAIIDRLTP